MRASTCVCPIYPSHPSPLEHHPVLEHGACPLIHTPAGASPWLHRPFPSLLPLTACLYSPVAQLAARAHAARASATSLKDTLRAQLREVRDARKQVREIVTHHTMPTKEEALKMAFTRVAKKRQLVATRLAKEHIAELHQVREEMEHMLKP